MIIHSLEIENVRALDAISLKQLPDVGIVLISGDNEQGKSTILEAFSTLLAVPHSSKAKAVKALQPAGKQLGPTVAADLSIGEYRISTRKQWLVGAKHELRVSAPAHAAGHFTGKEADAKLESIIQEHLDEALLRELFMEQNNLSTTFAAANIRSFADALERQHEGDAVGAAVPTTVMQHQQLETAIESEFLRYYTATGGEKKTSELGKARIALAEAKEQAEVHAQSVAALQEKVAHVESFQLQLADAEAALPAARETLVQVTEEYTQAQEKQQVLAAAEQVLDSAQRQRQYASELFAQRERMLADATQKQQFLEGLRQQLEVLKEAATSETSRLEEIEAQLQAQQEQRDGLASQLEQLRHILQVQGEREELEKLLATLQRIAEIDQQVQELEELPEITDAQLRSLEDAAMAVREARLVQQAQAAKLSLRTIPGAGTRNIVVDGEQVEVDLDTREFVVHDSIALEVDGVCAQFSAGMSTRELQLAIEQSQTALNTLLEECGVEDLEQAKKWHKEFQDAKMQCRQLQSERGLLLQGQPLEELQRRVSQLEQRAQHTEHGGDDSAEVCAETSAEDVAQKIVTLEEQLQAVHTAVRTLEVQQLEFSQGPKRHEHALAVATFAAHEEQYAAAQAAIAQAEQEAPTVALRQQEEDTVQAVVDAQAKLERVRDEVGEIDLEVLAQQRQSQENVVRELEDTVITFRSRLDALEQQITESAGAVERKHAADNAVQVAQRVCDAVERRANAAKLLWHTLTQHRSDQQQKYAKPFLSALNQMMRVLYPKPVEFDVDEQLQVTKRTMGDQIINVDALSGGAQEQLALVSRFAVASLVGDGQVPIFIDDALGATDPQRLRAVSGLIQHMGKGNQIFVLTCVPERYAALRADRRFDMFELKQANT